MTGTDERARRGRADKAEAMLRAACAVFGRDGYARAGIDAIAHEAGVSTRTIYNHFPGGKGELFRAVMQWSSTRVRDEQIARLRRYLDPDRPPHPDDLERDLLALARSWISLGTDFRDHFALVGHIRAEAAHIPPDALNAWQEAGPRAVTRETAAAMAALDAKGLLDVHGDPAQAAVHYVALFSTEITQRSFWNHAPLPQDEVDRLITGGVRAFLRAYGADPAST